MLGATHPRRGQSRRTVPAPVAGALVLLAGILVGVLIISIARDADTRGDDGSTMFDPFIGDRDDPSQPLITDGRQVGLQTALNVAKVPMLRPDHPLAADASISQVWLPGEPATEAAIRYASGIRLYITVWPAGSDPETFYQELVSQSGVGTARLINGSPAWVVEENEQSVGHPPVSVVDISVGRIELSIQGHFSTSELVAVAETVGATP